MIAPIEAKRQALLPERLPSAKPRSLCASASENRGSKSPRNHVAGRRTLRLIIGHLAERPIANRGAIGSGDVVPPGRIVIHPIGRVGDHQVRLPTGQQHLNIVAAVVRKKLGLNLESEKADGERVYRVTGKPDEATEPEAA